MKKLFPPVVLLALNLAAYYYLTEYVGINTTIADMVTILITMLFIVPLGSLPIAAMQYYFKRRLNPQQITFTPFRQIFIQTSLLLLSLVYAVVLCIAVMVYVNMKL